VFTWLGRNARWITFVGVCISAISNYAHNHLEDEGRRKSSIADTKDKYERLVSLHTTSSGDEVDEMFRISTTEGSDLSKLAKAVPTVDKLRREYVALFGGLHDLTEVISDEADDRRILFETGVALRLELAYQSLARRLHGNFTVLPKDPTEIHDLTTVANLYVRNWYNVAMEYDRLDKAVVKQADVQSARMVTASESELKFLRVLTWIGIFMPLSSLLHERQN
jgi:hypothetical protein